MFDMLNGHLPPNFFGRNFIYNILGHIWKDLDTQNQSLGQLKKMTVPYYLKTHWKSCCRTPRKKTCWLWRLHRYGCGQFYWTKLHIVHIWPYLNGFGYSELILVPFEKNDIYWAGPPTNEAGSSCWWWQAWHRSPISWWQPSWIAAPL